MHERFSWQLLDSGESITRRELIVGAGLVAGGLALGGVLAACGASTSTPAIAQPSPRRGGNFRLGTLGASTVGAATDTMDGQNNSGTSDAARDWSCFETLLTFNENNELTTDGLAESVTQDAPDQWTIRLRQGIEFHNGKTLSADDVIYSLRRIMTASLGLFGYAGLAPSLDPKNIQKLDDRTVRLHLSRPDSTIDNQLAQDQNPIVPVGYAAWPAPQIGTGPFKVQSFTPGQQSVHVRNQNYWRSGQPYFDQVTIIDFADATARVNALLAGQVDAIGDLPTAQVGIVKAHKGLAILESPTASWFPIEMAIDMPPFTDVRVRQAFRLIADRPQIVAQALSGYGRVANDLYAPDDPCFARDLPQRHQDLAQAKSLLKAAGQDGLTMDFHTTPTFDAMVNEAYVFAQQAKGAGVTLNVKNDPNFYGDQYQKLALSIDFWDAAGYLEQVSKGNLPVSPYNPTHWPPKDATGERYQNLYMQALAAVDKTKRCELAHEMQVIEYNEGGHIIAFFHSSVDAYSTKVSGFRPSRANPPTLDSFGHGYRTIWFNS